MSNFEIITNDDVQLLAIDGVPCDTIASPTLLSEGLVLGQDIFAPISGTLVARIGDILTDELILDMLCYETITVLSRFYTNMIYMRYITVENMKSLPNGLNLVSLKE